MTDMRQDAPTDEWPSTPVQDVLISGASFAGLVTAWWMNKVGYRVSIVELAPDLRRGGVPADIKGAAVEVLRHMGLLKEIKAQSLPARPMIVLDENGLALRRQYPEDAEPETNEEYEVERDALLDLLFNEVRADVEFMFSDSIATVEQDAERVNITFVSGRKQSFSLVFGCDGSHSTVRRLCFGEETSFVTFLKNYFSLIIVPKLLTEENTSTMFSVPGKTVILNCYNGKTDIIFSFASADEISYDRRDQDEQKRMIRKCFEGGTWRVAELLDEMDGGENFYFDKYCQVHMQLWTKGRIALVGDAAYAPSPAGGNGGSVAIMGAAALGQAFHKFPNKYAAAFQEYHDSFAPIVAGLQAETVDLWLDTIIPGSEEAIQKRNAYFGLG